MKNLKRISYDHAWMAVKDFEEGVKLYTKEGEKSYTRIETAPEILRYLYRLYKEE